MSKELQPRMVELPPGDLQFEFDRPPQQVDNPLPFRAQVQNCTRCKRRNECFAPVLPDGRIESSVYFQGRDPGKIEDEKRTPFHPSAPGGAQFNTYLKCLSLNREGVYITNSVFCHGQGDRTVSSDEHEACYANKLAELQTVGARFFFLLGNDALHQFIPGAGSVVHEMGNIYSVYDRYFIPVLHPGYAKRKTVLLVKTLKYLKALKPVLREIYVRNPDKRARLEPKSISQGVSTAIAGLSQR